MKFRIDRNVDKNKFETVISFEEYGSTDIDETEEKELLDNYPQTLSLKDIDFEGYFKVDENEVVSGVSKTDEKVTLTVLQREVPIDETFIVKYEIKTSQVLGDELGTDLSNPTLVCQAKSLLFENKVIEELERKLNIAKALDNDFEKQSPIIVTL